MKAERETLKEPGLKYGYRREIEAPFAETVEKTRKALADEGFGVLTEIDLKEKFKEKLNVDFREYVILGACNPPIAHSALALDLDLGLLLPCNVIVYENGGVTVVATVDATKMLSVTGNSNLETTAATVNEKLERALKSI